MVIIENKGNQDVKSIIIPDSYSIYTYNTYIDLDSGKLVSSSLISSWDLAFDASPTGWLIQVNGANSIEIAPTGSTNFSADFSNFNVSKWFYDASSGNPDSTAVGKWVSGDPGNYEYTNEVYLLGKNNGDGTSDILRKLVFLELDEEHVVFISALPGVSVVDTVIINKNPVYRYFSTFQDAIGYDWKDYNSKDSNPYRVVPDLYYFIKNRSGKLIKLEFTGYTSANAEYGYPAMRYINLN